MRLMCAILTLFLCASSAGGQILKISFVDDKTAGKYKKNLVRIDGKYHVLGEVKYGISLDKGKITINGQKIIELWVIDPGKPDYIPYKLKDGEKIGKNKKSKLTIPRKHLAPVGAAAYHMRDQTFTGLTLEYQIRIDAVNELLAARNQEKRSSDPWFKAQRRMLNAMERLQGWMQQSGFTRAAKKYGKKVASESRALKVDAVKERTHQSLNSVKIVETPSDLVQIAANIKGRVLTYKVQESRHVRIVYWQGISDGRVNALLKLAETMIEGWRREFVDPYADELEVSIPDQVISEFFFLPDDIKLYEYLWDSYFGGGWGVDKKRSLAMSGKRSRGRHGVMYNHYNRQKPDAGNYDGIIAHGLGHDLVNLTINEGRRSGDQDWMSEGAAYYLSFEFLGRNSVTCKQFKRDEYARAAGKEGLKTVQQGMRESFNKLALKKGVPFAQLMQTQLFKMDDADLAKSWSMFDYFARREGRQGIKFLRMACFLWSNTRGRPQFQSTMREDAKEIYKDLETDVFQLIENKWKRYAKVGQRKSRKNRTLR